MRIALLAVTEPGLQRARGLAAGLRGQGDETRVYGPERWIDSPSETAFQPGLGETVRDLFETADALVFLSAAGIAVRAIAPRLAGKYRDPAVVVVDEAGDFAISLLSGHTGGANRLAERIGGILGATPVITTATDRRGLTALDALAAEYERELVNTAGWKGVGSALVNGETVGIYADHPGLFDLVAWPSQVRRHVIGPAWEIDPEEKAIALITAREPLPDLPVPWCALRPKNRVAGIGLRKNVSAQAVQTALTAALAEAGCSPRALFTLATADFKAREPGLLSAAANHGLPVTAFSKAAIAAVEDRFENSDFVRRHTGIGAVAEPAAWLACREPVRILSKTKYRGVTVALYEDRSRW